MNFLKAKPFNTPLKEYERIFIHENFLAREWKKMPKGGVLCVDEAVVAEQKRVFKLICKQFGNKLFKLQGLSISLPVQICRPEYSYFHVGLASSAWRETFPMPPFSSKIIHL
jgi:hypothetical protein